MQSTQESLAYEDKKSLHTKIFSLGTIGGGNVNDKLILISLLSLTYLKMKEKNPKITVLEILKSITKQKADESYYYQMLEGLAILVEDLCYNCKTADSCGLQTSQEIITKIKEILNTWIPF